MLSTARWGGRVKKKYLKCSTIVEEHEVYRKIYQRKRKTSSWLDWAENQIIIIQLVVECVYCVSVGGSNWLPTIYYTFFSPDRNPKIHSSKARAGWLGGCLQVNIFKYDDKANSALCWMNFESWTFFFARSMLSRLLDKSLELMNESGKNPSVV